MLAGAVIQPRTVIGIDMIVNTGTCNTATKRSVLIPIYAPASLSPGTSELEVGV